MPDAPKALQAERDVLAACLLDPSLVDVAAGILTEADWYTDQHRAIWGALVALSTRAAGIDATTVRAELEASRTLARAGGDEYLLTLASTIPTTSNLETHARLVREKATRRRMIEACTVGASRGFDETIATAEYVDHVQAAVFDAARDVDGRGGPVRVREVLPEVVEAFAAASKSNGITGLPTGLSKLDRLTTGLHAGELHVWAGRPGMGKTSLATGTALHASLRLCRPVVFFSIEMPRGQIVARTICSDARLSLRDYRAGRLSRDEMGRYSAALEPLARAPFYVDETPGVTLMQVRARSRRIRAQEGDLALVVVDYLQLMRSGLDRESRELEVADISRGLKALAKELGCPVVALAQLNRGAERRTDHRPMLSDLRESGSIEQDADAVVMIYRDEVYDPQSNDKGVAELIVAKQRNGPTGTARVRYLAESSTFADLVDDYGGGPGDFHDD